MCQSAAERLLSMASDEMSTTVHLSWNSALARILAWQGFYCLRLGRQESLGQPERARQLLEQSLEAKRRKTEEINTMLTADNKRLATSREMRCALDSELAVLTDMTQGQALVSIVLCYGNNSHLSYLKRRILQVTKV